MKETNMEHYRGEIEATGYNFAFEGGKIVACDNSFRDVCKGCLFDKRGDLSCASESVKWLMSEYKPEPVLTAREKHFVEFAQEGWLVRDEDGRLWWCKAKPRKGKIGWFDGQRFVSFAGIIDFSKHFRFITWEDEELWSVSDLRKLKALEYNPEDVALTVDLDKKILVVIDTTNNKKYGMQQVKEER